MPQQFEWNDQTVKELLDFIQDNRPIMMVFEGCARLESVTVSPKDYIINQFKTSKKEPEVLFVTEDCVEVTDPDTPLYMVLAKATWQTSETTTKCHLRRAVAGSSAWKYFSSENARARYILMNKPTLSVLEVMEKFPANTGHFADFQNRILAIAKSKIQP